MSTKTITSQAFMLGLEAYRNESSIDTSLSAKIMADDKAGCLRIFRNVVMWIQKNPEMIQIDEETPHSLDELVAVSVSPLDVPSFLTTDDGTVADTLWSEDFSEPSVMWCLEIMFGFAMGEREPKFGNVESEIFAFSLICFAGWCTATVLKSELADLVSSLSA